MQESLIGVLNRRFVSTYFNSFRGEGADPEARAFVMKKAGNAIRYGGIFTPEGEFLVGFGDTSGICQVGMPRLRNERSARSGVQRVD